MKTKVCLTCTLIIAFATILSLVYSDNSPRSDGGNMAGSLDANDRQVTETCYLSIFF